MSKIHDSTIDAEIANLLFQILTLGASSFVGGIIPRFFSSQNAIGNLMEMINCFATGLLLSIAVLDMMPEIGCKTHSHDIKIDRMASFCMGTTLILLLVIETLIHRWFHKHSHKHSEGFSQLDNHNHLTHAGIEKSEDHHNHHADIIMNSNGGERIFLLLSLSIHSFLEGIEHGVDSPSHFHFFCLNFHKFFETFSIGSVLFRSKMTMKNILLIIVIFSFITPFSILFGFFGFKKLSENFKFCLKGISLGSLCYVVFFESIPEILNANDSLFRICTLFIGYCVGSAFICTTHTH